jgi:hypothetical protein
MESPDSAIPEAEHELAALRRSGAAEMPAVLAAAILAAFVLGLCTAARAATITVNSLVDPGAPGICALRDAITAANNRTRVNGCAAGNGQDTIRFSVSGTIELSDEGLPEITDRQLIVNGPITVGDSNAGPAWFVGPSATVKLMSVSIDDVFGGAGTAITNMGALTFTNGSVTRCEFAVINVGTLTVTKSTFSNNFGDVGFGPSAIGNEAGATLAVTNSTFSGNVDWAVENDGQASITNSTFTGNAGLELAGAILNSSDILSADQDGTLIVVNSTFSGNLSYASAGAISNTAKLTIISSTFSGNFSRELGEQGPAPGDIDNFVFGLSTGSVSLKNSIFAGSTVFSSATPISNCSGIITDAGYNISDDDSCGFGATGSRNNTNPGLSSDGLVNNGGPTQTIALASDSPAIDVIPVADCTDQNGKPLRTDQRGFPRPDAGEDVCDIGAYESQETFAGQPGGKNCQGVSVSSLTNQYGSIRAAASALDFPNVPALQIAIEAFCRA